MINPYKILNSVTRRLSKAFSGKTDEDLNMELVQIFSFKQKYKQNLKERDLDRIRRIVMKMYKGDHKRVNVLFDHLQDSIRYKQYAVEYIMTRNFDEDDKLSIKEQQSISLLDKYFFSSYRFLEMEIKRELAFRELNKDEVCLKCIEKAIRDDIYCRIYRKRFVEMEERKERIEWAERQMHEHNCYLGERLGVPRAIIWSVVDDKFDANALESEEREEYLVWEAKQKANRIKIQKEKEAEKQKALEEAKKFKETEETKESTQIVNENDGSLDSVKNPICMNLYNKQEIHSVQNPFEKDVEAEEIVDNPFKNFQEISKESTKDKNVEIQSKKSVKDDDENNTHSKNYIPTIVETSNNDLQKIDNRMCDANKSTLTSTNVNDSADFKPLTTKQNEEYNKKPSSGNEIFDSNQPTAINYNKLTETKSTDLKEEDRIDFNNAFEQNNKFALPVFDNMKYQEQVENKKAKSNDYQQVHNSTSAFNIDNNNLLSQSAFQNNNLFNNCSNTSNNTNQQQNSHETFVGKKFEFNSQPSSNVPPSFPQHQEQNPNNSVTNFSLQQPAFNMNDLSSGNFTNNNNDFNPFSNSNIFQKECDSNNDNQQSLFGNRNDNDADKNRKRKFYEEFF